MLYSLCNYGASNNPNCSVKPFSPDGGSNKNSGDFAAAIYHHKDRVSP